MSDYCCSIRNCRRPAEVEVMVHYLQADLLAIAQNPHPHTPHLCLTHAKAIEDHPIFKPTIIYKPINSGVV